VQAFSLGADAQCERILLETLTSHQARNRLVFSRLDIACSYDAIPVPQSGVIDEKGIFLLKTICFLLVVLDTTFISLFNSGIRLSLFLFTFHLFI
jgi:hypothetical protein